MGVAKRIWLLDDDEAVLGLYERVLSAAGYTVMAARTLKEFDKHLHAFDTPPDLVLLDVRMPDLFGDEIALMLRGVRNVHVPIFLISSMDEKELVARATEVGATGAISKTVGPAGLVKRVREAIG